MKSEPFLYSESSNIRLPPTFQSRAIRVEAPSSNP
ncbi:Uncharacterised protein [Bordetella pertussis]|nr:Uncharacterised protein [Bordetella pertussis]CFU81608.1 Uncharacterised protein [Bordetella pertussis]CPL78317.1 Uncharacterised protein [Bordetella pertussis]CPO67679.1 Uncharacterised protein [Bordetella pertussis]